MEMFGPYRLEELLGQGGMGEVYRAFDTRRQRTVALKRLRPQLAADAEYQERFRRESRLAARLSSPHVIPIHDFGEIDGRLFIDMRFAVGTDLGRQLAESGPLPPGRAVEIVRQVADALDSAHEDGLVHRDVKPSNVLITSDRNRDFAYLVDFGIVRAMATSTNSSLTAAGLAIGTLAYMAPELFSGGQVDRRVDVYALGCLFFEALTGQPPFTGEGPTLIYHHLYTEPPRPSAHRRDLPPGFDAVVGRAMAKDPGQRYATAGQLADAAQQALSDHTPRGSIPPRPPDHDQVTRLATGSPPDPANVAPGQRNPAQAPPSWPPAPPRPRSKLPLILGIAGMVLVLAVASAILAAVLSADGTTVDEPIPVGAEPNDVEVGEGFVWTANRSSDTISRVDPSDATSQEITVGGNPTLLEADQGAVWVWNYIDAITRVDVRTGEVSPITGGSPDAPISGIAVGGGYVWLSHSANGTVTRINMQTQAREGDPIAVGPKPLAMVFGDKFLYVVNSGDSTISTLNGPTGEVLGTPLKINQDLTGCSACIDIHDGVIYIATNDGVTPIDERYFIIGEPIPLKGYSHYTIGGGSLWVAYPLDNVIRRIDLSNRQPRGEPIKGIGRGVGEVALSLIHI